jgi:hypothetical protein
MKVVRTTMLGLALVFFLVAAVHAAQGEKTLKGTITCAKCDLKLEKGCTTVIQVKEGDKNVVYYFDADAHKKNHKAVCQAGKAGTVTGTVEKKGDKNIVTVKELKFD